MHLRRDAAYVAAALTTFVRQLALDLAPAQVATVGRLEVRPDLVNVVANRATMTIDLRNTDDAVLRRAEAALAAEVERLAEAEGVAVSSRSLARFEPVDFDPATIDLVETTARRLGHTTRRMPSGAGHDAQMLARICPAAMIFTPERRRVVAQHRRAHPPRRRHGRRRRAAADPAQPGRLSTRPRRITIRRSAGGANAIASRIESARTPSRSAG